MPADSDNKMPNLFENNYGLFIFAVFGICFIPFVFYTVNAAEFGQDYKLLGFPTLLALLVIFFGILIRVVFGFSSKTNDLIQLAFSFLGLLIFINDLFVPTKAMSLDGTLNLIPEPMVSTVIELILAIVLIIFIVKYKNSKPILIEIGKYSIGIYLLLVIMAIYTSIDLSHESNNRNSTLVSQGNNASKPNVYMLWLDGMQSDYFTKGVEKLELVESFEGFTQFVNNMSNYIYSWHSYKSFFSSSFYDGNDFTKWKASDPLRTIMKSEGYRLTTYSKANFHSELDDENVYINDIYELMDGTNYSNPYVVDYVSLSLVRMAPNFLANEALDLGVEIGNTINQFVFAVAVDSDKSIKQINSVNDGMYPYMSKLVFRKSIEDEKKRMDNGEFVLLHAIIPHAPYVLDPDCNYVGVRKNKKKSQRRDVPYYEQALCAINLAVEFLDELKRQDKYDESVIVIFGDHGNGTTDILKNKFSDNKSEPVNARYSHFNNDKLFARTKALLMFKPARQDDSGMVISSKESQLIDIVPTLISLIGIAKPEEYDFEGVNLYLDGKVNRKSLLFYFKLAMFYNMEDAEVYEVEFNQETQERTGKISFIEKFKVH